jgi:hypothetical protein
MFNNRIRNSAFFDQVFFFLGHRPLRIAFTPSIPFRTLRFRAPWPRHIIIPSPPFVATELHFDLSPNRSPNHANDFRQEIWLPVVNQLNEHSNLQVDKVTEARSVSPILPTIPASRTADLPRDWLVRTEHLSML